MKKLIVLFLVLGLATLLTFMGTMFSGCSKEGPMGPAGADANATCGECHDVSQQIVARVIQYQASQHAMGATFERNGTSCAPCHTHGGFLEVLSTGLWETAEAIANPTPANCRTCHMIHSTYTDDDYALTTTSPFKLMINDETVDFGDATVCARCHQPRIPDPCPDMALLTDSVIVTSSRYGAHYGAQAVILSGTGLFEITGPESYPAAGSSTHMKDGCQKCHMPEPYGSQAGGHTMSMTYEYHGSDAGYVEGCETCHAGASDFDINGKVTIYDSLFTQYTNMLVTEGLIDTTSHYGTKGTITNLQAAHAVNWTILYNDHSHGVHNYDYMYAALVNGIADLKK